MSQEDRSVTKRSRSKLERLPDLHRGDGIARLVLSNVALEKVSSIWQWPVQHQ